MSEKTKELSIWKQPYTGKKNQVLNPKLVLTLSSIPPGQKLDGTFTAEVLAIFTKADDYDTALEGTLAVTGIVDNTCYNAPKVFFTFENLYFTKKGWYCFEVLAYDDKDQPVDVFRTQRIEIT
jgi:hypothetical protein